MAQLATVTIWGWKTDERGNPADQRQRRVEIPPHYSPEGIRQLQYRMLEELIQEVEDEVGWPIDRGRMRMYLFDPPVFGRTE